MQVLGDKTEKEINSLSESSEQGQFMGCDETLNAETEFLCFGLLDKKKHCKKPREKN